MTNDPYHHLRIALAEGKCVTDRHDRPMQIIYTEGYVNGQLYVFTPDTGWYQINTLQFGENSRIVPDPSLTEGCNCINYHYCTSKEPQSLTYEQALAATKIAIQFPGYVASPICERLSEQVWTYTNLCLFDLAERRGYKMTIVE